MISSISKITLVFVCNFGLFTKQECGIPNFSKIVGGNDTGGYHYPWFAQLRLVSYQNKPVCAGSLITKRHVISAAHCFTISPGTPLEKLYKVALGVYDTCLPYESTRETFDVIRVDVHEKYSKKGKFFDIALMTLEREADFTTICLPKTGVYSAPQQGMVIGFGVTKEGSRVPPCRMREAFVTIYTMSQCGETLLPTEDSREPSVLCAGDVNGNVDSCQGDSGGPLQIARNGKFSIQGIVSYGYGCANKGLPGVYTNVYSYIDWIRNKIYTHVTPIHNNQEATAPDVMKIQTVPLETSSNQQRRNLQFWYRERIKPDVIFPGSAV